MKKQISNSKALSGLVATSLLLLIGILMFGSFQVWYVNYSDDIMDTFEEVSPSQITIEKFEGNLLYVKNTASSDLNITEIKIGNISYPVNEIVTRDNLSIINLSDYLGHSNQDIEEIALVSNRGIFSDKKIVTTEYSYLIIGVNDQTGLSNCSKLNSANDKVVEVLASAGICEYVTFCNENFQEVIYAPVDGVWSAWGPYGACSVSCGGGLKYSYRTCTNPAPSCGGAACVGSNVQSLSCNTGCCTSWQCDSCWVQWYIQCCDCVFQNCFACPGGKASVGACTDSWLYHWVDCNCGWKCV